MFYLKTIKQLLLFIDQLDQKEVCLPNIRNLTGIPKMVVFQNLRWNSNNTCLENKTNVCVKCMHWHYSSANTFK